MGRRRTIPGKRVLITGASSGIGEAIAKELAQSGARLLLVARSEDRLERAARSIRQSGGEAHPCPGDITSADDRQRAVQASREYLGGLDILVNNAGIGASSPFLQSSARIMREILEVNFFGLVEMTRACLPLLVDGQDPMIVNISSIFGRRAFPSCSEYCASKFAVSGFSEALRVELRPHGVDVLLVNPGLTDTPFREHMIQRGPRSNWGRNWSMSAEKVARQTVRAMRRGKHEISLAWPGRVLLGVNKFAPRLVDWLMAKL